MMRKERVQRNGLRSADQLSVAERSAQMFLIKSKDTKPELAVRRLIYSMGYRYRLHAADIPGTPDIAFRQRRKVIFVHGCFWHGHECTRGQRLPKGNREYWSQKIKRTMLRDKNNQAQLRGSGWMHLTIWDCELKQTDRLTEVIRFSCTSSEPR